MIPCPCHLQRPNYSYKLRACDAEKRLFHDLAEGDFCKALSNGELEEDHFQLQRDILRVECRTMPVVSLGKGGVMIAVVVPVVVAMVMMFFWRDTGFVWFDATSMHRFSGVLQ